jgi:hypothetical protein
VLNLAVRNLLRCSHILNTPLQQQAAYCATTNHRDLDPDSFPCKGSPLERAQYVLSHLHLAPSSDIPVLATQLVQLTTMLVLVTDLLRVWPRRWVVQQAQLKHHQNRQCSTLTFS